MTISLAVIALCGALGVGDPDEVARARDVPAAAGERSGLLGLGLGLEVPMVGVTTGVAPRPRLAWGYTLGAAISWEVVPTTVLRIWVSRAQTYAATARVRYLEEGSLLTVEQSTDWRSLDAGLGASYLWRRMETVIPYVGGGVGMGFAGHLYHFDDDLKEQLEPPETGIDVTSFTHAAIDLVWTAGAWIGTRLDLAPGLAGQVELSAFYLALPRREITETRAPRKARAPAEEVVLLRLAYSVRLGL